MAVLLLVGVVFLIAGSSAHADTVVAGTMHPSGVAVDGAGDVYIANPENHRVLVDKPNGSGGYTQSVLGAAVSDPEGMAVDRSGDVYIADTSNNRVVVVKLNGSGGYTQSVVDGTGLADPTGVAVDRSGDVYIADTDNNRVVVVKPNGSGGYIQSVVEDTGLAGPVGVAVDGSGDVFISEEDNNRVVVDKPNGSGGYTQSVVDDSGLNNPDGVAVDGSGDVYIADNGNFRVLVDKPTGSGGYTQSTVDDSLAGPAWVAVDGSGDVYISDDDGAFTSRVLVEKPNGSGGYTQGVVDDSGLNDPDGVAVDGSGDVFIVDTLHNRVVVDKPNGSGGYTQSLVDDSGLDQPQGVAVDRSGDVFIADPFHSRVVVDKPDGSGGYTQSVFEGSPDVSDPEGVAVDGSGDVFIADTGHGRVVVEKPNGAGGYIQSTVDASVDNPYGVAVDGSGDVYIANPEYGDSRVVVDKPNGAGGYTQSTVDTDVSNPFGVAVDRSGDVYIADDNRVVVDKPNGAGGYTQQLFDSGVFGPQGVAVDGSGDVFIADTGDSRVIEHPATDPTASFTGAQTAGVLTVAFTDASTAVSPATITGWSWNFGDGTPPSSAENPSHAYAASGSYAVSLTVTDSAGRTNTASQKIEVLPLQASLTDPTAGQTDVNTGEPFSWSGSATGQGYQLWIGRSRGDGSLLKSGLLSAATSSYQVPALPIGVTLWARLYTGVAGTWDYEDVPFTVTANRFTYPTAGQQNVNTLTPFSWNPAPNAQAYRLTIATKPGAADLVNSGILASTITSYREPALPTGKTLYARLAWEVDGSWSAYQDVSFTAASNPVAFIHPTQGETGVKGPTTFTWSTSPAATGYQLWVGTTRGSGSLLKSGLLKATISSYTLPALPAGQTLWARIYTGVTSGWGNWQDISFTTATSSKGSMTLTRQTTITNQLIAHAGHQRTPAWMRRLLRLEPDLHQSSHARHR